MTPLDHDDLWIEAENDALSREAEEQGDIRAARGCALAIAVSALLVIAVGWLVFR